MNPALLIVLVVFALGSLGALLFASIWKPLVAVILWVIAAQILPKVCNWLLVLGYSFGPFTTRQLGIRKTTLAASLRGLTNSGEPAHAFLGLSCGWMLFNVVTGWPGAQPLAALIFFGSVAILTLRGLLAYGIHTQSQDQWGHQQHAPIIVDVESALPRPAPRIRSAGRSQDRTQIVETPQKPTDTRLHRDSDDLEEGIRLERIGSEYASLGRHKESINSFIESYHSGNKTAELLRKIAASFFALGEHENAELAAVEAARLEQAEQSQHKPQQSSAHIACTNCGRVSKSARTFCSKCRMALARKQEDSLSTRIVQRFW
jgi:ribosomal protein L37E